YMQEQRFWSRPLHSLYRLIGYMPTPIRHTDDSPSQAQEPVFDDNFWDLSDEDAIKSVANAFVPELERLKRVPEPAESGSSEKKKTCFTRCSQPSYLLFGEDYPEVNRTL